MRVEVTSLLDARGRRGIGFGSECERSIICGVSDGRGSEHTSVESRVVGNYTQLRQLPTSSEHCKVLKKNIATESVKNLGRTEL